MPSATPTISELHTVGGRSSVRAIASATLYLAVSFGLLEILERRLGTMKLLTDFAGFFFVSYAGTFDPTLLVRDSNFAHTMSFYGYVFGFGGFLAIAWSSIRHRDLQRWMYVILVAGFSSAYIVLTYGQTRFRASIQPLLLLSLAYGLTHALAWPHLTDRSDASDVLSGVAE